jgi:hypothetical protein
MSEQYRTENNIDGAKSSAKTVPPIGAGNKTIFFRKCQWLINAGQTQVVQCTSLCQWIGLEKVRGLIVDFLTSLPTVNTTNVT